MFFLLTECNRLLTLFWGLPGCNHWHTLMYLILIAVSEICFLHHLRSFGEDTGTFTGVVFYQSDKPQILCFLPKLKGKELYLAFLYTWEARGKKLNKPHIVKIKKCLHWLLNIWIDWLLITLFVGIAVKIFCRYKLSRWSGTIQSWPI